ncbi:MAG: hypothetical protein JO322_00850 [Candidatus Eremiobacteraeota bacterium]|nr:hypothetical protein [Candidatus Eremiobacteraeota bacterium]
MPTRHGGMLTASRRGGAMAETVAVLGFILALLFGTSQVVLAGYDQLQLDAATFLYSHAYALTGSVPATKMGKVLPIVPAGSVVTKPSSPPNTEGTDANAAAVLGEYTTGGVANGPTAPNSSRYGGASIILPQQIVSQATLSLPSFDLSLFTNPIVMTSGNIEGRAMVANHDDDSTGYGYNSALSSGDLVLPSTVNGDDQNVPPYYFAMAWMKQCNSNIASGDYFDCAQQGSNIYALGLAEFLKDVSKSSATNGNYQNGTNGVGYGNAFGAMTCHQRFYASIAAMLQSSSNYSQLVLTQPNVFQIAAMNAATGYDVDTSTLSGGVGGDYGANYPQNPNYLFGGAC